jgi:hypothetical protein
VLALFAVIGFWGGAILQKHQDNKTATSRAAAALASALTGRRGATGATGGAGGAGATGASGFGGFGGGAGRTVGTVTDVEGSTVYVTNAAGTIVKVNLAPTTKITKSDAGTAADIALGSSVVVTGTAGSDGSTTASAITLTPAAPAATGSSGGG